MLWCGKRIHRSALTLFLSLGKRKKCEKMVIFFSSNLDQGMANDNFFFVVDICHSIKRVDFCVSVYANDEKKNGVLKSNISEFCLVFVAKVK